MEGTIRLRWRTSSYGIDNRELDGVDFGDSLMHSKLRCSNGDHYVLLRSLNK